MEEKKYTEDAVLSSEDVKDVAGGADGYRGGYCPFTEDRNCRIKYVGSFDPKNEDCLECGYRAW